MEEPATNSEEKKLPAPEDKLLRPPTFWEKYGKLSLLIFLLFFILILIVVFSFINKSPASPQPLAPTQPLPTSLPSPTTDPTANWKTYRNEKLGFEFKYNDFYKIANETNSSVSFGQKADDGSIIPYLTISTNQITNYKSYKSCIYGEENDAYSQSFPCLESGERWGQKEDIVEEKLGGVSAKSYYIAKGFPDATYHIVQTIGDPKIEAKMFVSGGGLDISFNQILSTFKFLDQTTSQIIPLSTVWQMGTTTFTDPKLGISFVYPKRFTIDVTDISSDPYYAEAKITFFMFISSPDIPIEQMNRSDWDWAVYDENAMSIHIEQYDNSTNQTLGAFRAKQKNAGRPIPGLTDFPKERVIDSTIPVPGSYIVFTGTLEGSDVKEYYFINKDKIYEIRLYGGHSAGDSYSADAEKVFDKIISSIKFTQ